MTFPRLRSLRGGHPLLVMATFAAAFQAGGGGSPTDVLDLDGQPLGTVRFPTSCDPAAQEHLERGLALLHHMTYLAAEREFAAAADADPGCALAHWGVAMTHVHPLWPDVVPPDKLVAGRRRLDRAAAAGHRSDREDGYIAALRAYYDTDEGGEMGRLVAFLEGWKAVHRDNPDDPEAKLFHALALTAVATADTGDKTYTRQRAAGAMAEEVLAEIPRHPGAHHYIIHAYDFPPLAKLALPVARAYDEVAPENSHALHMTSHIFTRLGLWPESIAFNIRAARAARERTPSGEISMHHMHAIDYLMYAYLQTANDAAARETLDAMAALAPPFQDHAATAYAFAAGPVRYALERHDWEAAARVATGWPEEVDWDRYPHLQAIPHFARALGAAQTGDRATAEASIAELSKLRERAAALDMGYDWGVQVDIQRLAATAWLLFETEESDRAVEFMRRAAEMESSTEKSPVTPGEVLPARELFGDMLLRMGRYAEARAQYEAALERSPNRFNGLFGAGRASELAGERELAASFYRELLENCPDSDEGRARLDHARSALEQGR